MTRSCKSCIHRQVCEIYDVTNESLEAIGCVHFLDAADVAPKTEVDSMPTKKDYFYVKENGEIINLTARTEARKLLSDLKKAVHDKAVYSYSKEMYPYINLKVFDAIIADYLKRLEGKNNG